MEYYLRIAVEFLTIMALFFLVFAFMIMAGV